MMFKNRLHSFGAMLCLLLAMLFLPSALAESGMPSALTEEARDQLEIHITAKPAEMVEPGDVMLNFSIENISGEAAENVYLSSSDGLLSEPVGRLSAGETQSFNRQHSVSQEELDAGEISYIISHDDPIDSGSKVNYTISATIRRSDVLPQAEFTRQFSSRSVPEGGTLMITYRIRNTGNVPLVNLRVQDTLGDYTGRVDRLAVGESRALISRAVIDESAVSSAVLDYYAEGDSEEIYSLPLEDVSVSIAHTGLETSFSAGVSAFSGDTVEAVLRLTNTGNVDIRDVCIRDDIYGGMIADSLVIPAGGAPVEVNRSYALRGDMRFRWNISGISVSGEKVHYTTPEVPLSEETNGLEAALLVEASAETPRIRRSGDVSIHLRISNPGDTDIKNVVLSEALLGELRNFAVIPAGGCIDRSFSFHVAEDTAYSFSAAWQDASGSVQHAASAPVEIAIAPDGVLPEGAKPGFIEFTGTSIKIGGSSTFAILMIAGLSVLLVLIILLLIASRRARIEKQMRIAAEKQRRREEMGKTNRFTPVRAPKNKAKGR